MGGYGSGRTGSRPTSEGCASLVLSISVFRRAGLRLGMKAAARLVFTVDGKSFPIAFVIDTTDNHFPFIEFVHRGRDRDESAQRYRVPLLRSPQRFGGVRWWFQCPQTGKRSVKLYLPLGGYRFWSRGAYQLGYASQREDRMSRAQRQAIKVYRTLGGEGNWRDDPPPKPKWMRWRTYERLAERLDHYNARFDGEWLTGVSRLLRRRSLGGKRG